jgi:hypothetical protein
VTAPSQLVADHLGVDAAPRARVLELLEQQAARALADDDPVALRVEGARRALGLVVARRRREEHVEDGRVEHVELLGPARQHPVL